MNKSEMEWISLLFFSLSHRSLVFICVYAMHNDSFSTFVYLIWCFVSLILVPSCICFVLVNAFVCLSLKMYAWKGSFYFWWCFCPSRNICCSGSHLNALNVFVCVFVCITYQFLNLMILSILLSQYRKKKK